MVGIIQDHHGGAVAVQTYSNASVHRCSFAGNIASDDGGAIYVRRRSFINVTESTFESNRARNSGGSVLVQNSKGFLYSSTFTNESALLGYGGSISVENVGNVTISTSDYIRCTGVFGGTISVVSESTMNLLDSGMTYSHSAVSGGGVYINHQSALWASNVTIDSSISLTGGGITVSDSSTINLDETVLFFNTAFESGGAIYCDRSDATIEQGIFKRNNASRNGGGLYMVSCSATVDNTSFLFNNSTEYGGSVYTKSSMLEMHNSIGQDGDAKDMSGMAMITYKSTFKCWNFVLKLESDNVVNSITIANNSVAEIHHLYIVISPGSNFCPVIVIGNSHATVKSIYYSNISNSTNVLWNNNSQSENLSFGGKGCDGNSSKCTNVFITIKLLTCDIIYLYFFLSIALH